jgi:hypothetical protein
MAVDFEIASRVVLTGTAHSKKKAKKRSAADLDGKGAETVSKRAYNFAAASRIILKICGGVALPQATSISTLAPFWSTSVAGLPVRRKILFPEHVFKELATQAMT